MSKQNRAPGALPPGEQPEHLDQLTRRLLSDDPKVHENASFIYRRIASTESRHDALAQVIRIWQHTESWSERHHITAALRRIGESVVTDLHDLLNRPELPAYPASSMMLLVDVGPCSQAEIVTFEKVAHHPLAKEAVRNCAWVAMKEIYKRRRQSNKKKQPSKPGVDIQSADLPRPRDQLTQRLLAQDIAVQDAGILIYRTIASVETRRDALDQLVHIWRFAKSKAGREQVAAIIRRIGQHAFDDLRDSLTGPDLPLHPAIVMFLLVDLGDCTDADAAAMGQVARHPCADEVVRQFAQQKLREIREKRQRG